MRLPPVVTDAIRVVCDTENDEQLLDFQVSLYDVDEIPEPIDIEHYDVDRSEWLLISPETKDASFMFDGNKKQCFGLIKECLLI